MVESLLLNSSKKEYLRLQMRASGAVSLFTPKSLGLGMPKKEQWPKSWYAGLNKNWQTMVSNSNLANLNQCCVLLENDIGMVIVLCWNGNTQKSMWTTNVQQKEYCWISSKFTLFSMLSKHITIKIYSILHSAVNCTYTFRKHFSPSWMLTS